MRYVLGAAAVAGLCLATWGTAAPSRRAIQAKAGADAVGDENAPRRPQKVVDVGEPPGARTVHVKHGGNLQKAIDDAAPGDVITLDAGATYEGPFSLPRRDRDGWIVITTAPSAKSQPQTGERVQPAQTAAMAKLVAASNSVVMTQPGAHHYRLVNLEMAPMPGATVYSIVELGDKDGSAEAQPHHIVIDRCYLRGDRQKGARRGVAVNGRDIAVINSRLSDFKDLKSDSQAIAGWNGSGPIRIANNYLEAAGENIMFGGAD